jgi:hypothetical protein
MSCEIGTVTYKEGRLCRISWLAGSERRKNPQPEQEVSGKALKLDPENS